MKKLLLLAGVIALTAATQVFAEEDATAQQPCPPATCREVKQQPECGSPDRAEKPRCDMQKLEEDLNLTDKQKEEANQLREKQMEAAKPLLEQLKVKEGEAQAIKDQLRELRIQGKQDFEAILTKKQLKKLETIKEERKQEFDKKHDKYDMRRRPPMPPQCNCNKEAPAASEAPADDEE